MTTTLEVENVSLNAQDRCDRCGAQARKVLRKGDLELMFCNHHHNQHGIVLDVQGWTAYADEAPVVSSHSD